MEDKEFYEIFGKMNKEERDELCFKALGGKKRKKNYVIDEYYAGLGYYVGGMYWNDIEKELKEIGKIKTQNGTRESNSGDLSLITKAKEKFNLRYSNEIISGNYNNPFYQFFVCNAEDVRFF